NRSQSIQKKKVYVTSPSKRKTLGLKPLRIQKKIKEFAFIFFFIFFYQIFDLFIGFELLARKARFVFFSLKNEKKFLFCDFFLFFFEMVKFDGKEKGKKVMENKVKKGKNEKKLKKESKNKNEK
ncbi:hypothetical protein RFI_34531, partial [Reticulomyxa filosa]